MATEKLTPVKPEAEKSVNELILLELQKQSEYLNRLDWKFWMMYNIVKVIAEENGYDIETKE
jgi:hypothetical protein